ncbi:helix-turn-helix transcriptional regulator [uncultured Bradyrhizobium sp.]|uniref:helix-turn-helix transcriptional regulator n=1 Tax=uncultured Bradyrhizobium sp. TaxID=199684 RepID=UPI0035CB2BAC
MINRLTLREMEVLRWTAFGKTSKETSEILNISINTVNFHIKNMMSKLGTVNRASTVASAIKTGLLEMQ